MRTNPPFPVIALFITMLCWVANVRPMVFTVHSAESIEYHMSAECYSVVGSYGTSSYLYLPWGYGGYGLFVVFFERVKEWFVAQ